MAALTTGIIASLIISGVISLLTTLPFIFGLFKIFTNTQILITIIVVIGLVAIVKAKKRAY